jgi:hypothetical protein
VLPGVSLRSPGVSLVRAFACLVGLRMIVTGFALRRRMKAEGARRPERSEPGGSRGSIFSFNYSLTRELQSYKGLNESVSIMV